MSGILAKTRRQAIEILEIYANNYYTCTMNFVERHIGVTWEASDLATAAYSVFGGCGVKWLLEAAGLLRDGWSPGDYLTILATGRPTRFVSDYENFE